MQTPRSVVLVASVRQVMVGSSISGFRVRSIGSAFARMSSGVGIPPVKVVTAILERGNPPVIGLMEVVPLVPSTSKVIKMKSSSPVTVFIELAA